MKKLTVRSVIGALIILLTSVSFTVSGQTIMSDREEGLPADFIVGEVRKVRCLPTVEVVAFIDTSSTERICGSFCYRDKIDSTYRESSKRLSFNVFRPNGTTLVYPNPSLRGSEINVVLVENGQITLYDLNGRIMMAQLGKPGINRVRVPVSYSTGTYLLRQGTRTSKIVIQ